MSIDAYCRWLSRYFFAVGHDSDDLYQEARLAAWLAEPCHARVAAMRQVLDVIKIANRKPLLTEPIDVSCGSDMADRVEAREFLRLLPSLPPNERQALGRVIRGEPIRRHEKALQSSLVRARKRLESHA